MTLPLWSSPLGNVIPRVHGWGLGRKCLVDLVLVSGGQVPFGSSLLLLCRLSWVINMSDIVICSETVVIGAI